MHWGMIYTYRWGEFGCKSRVEYEDDVVLLGGDDCELIDDIMTIFSDHAVCVFSSLLI